MIALFRFICRDRVAGVGSRTYDVDTKTKAHFAISFSLVSWKDGSVSS